MNPATRAQILGQEQIRRSVVRAMVRTWRRLPGYDRQDVPGWLDQALPIVESGQRSSAALTNAYLARMMDRRPYGMNFDELIGSAVRAGEPMEDVYARPFVTTWTSLKGGSSFEQATAAGLARAASMAAMDVQMTMRATSAAVSRVDPDIEGFVRVADAGACDLCASYDGASVPNPNNFALHPSCGCQMEPETEARPETPPPEGVAVNDHGELGPVLGDAAHNFDHTYADIPF